MRKSKAEIVREYMAEIGSRGGQVKGPKGFAVMTTAERKANAKRAAEARWAKKQGSAAKKKA